MELQAPVIPSPEQLALMQKKQKLQSEMRNGLNWFFWIAGLSIINTIIFTAGGKITFIIGLGATQFVDGLVTGFINELGSNYSAIIRLIGFGVNIGITGIFIIAGLLSQKKYRWATIAGMILYVLDALIFIWIGDWIAVAFHGLALWGLWRGLRAMNQLFDMERTTNVTIPVISGLDKPAWYKSSGIRILGGACLIYAGIAVVLAVIGFVLTR